MIAFNLSKKHAQVHAIEQGIGNGKLRKASTKPVTCSTIANKWTNIMKRVDLQHEISRTQKV